MYRRGGPHEGQSAFCFISPETKKAWNCKTNTSKVSLFVIHFRFPWTPYFLLNNSVTESQTVANNFAHRLYCLCFSKPWWGNKQLYFSSSLYPSWTWGTQQIFSFPPVHCVRHENLTVYEYHLLETWTFIWKWQQHTTLHSTSICKNTTRLEQYMSMWFVVHNYWSWTLKFKFWKWH
jgi:hypothetical protein